MTVDRRTFLVGTGAATVAGVLAGIDAAFADGLAGALLPGLAPHGTSDTGTNAAASAGLRIVGWDVDSDGPMPSAPALAHGDASWIVIDRQWRGSWH